MTGREFWAWFSANENRIWQVQSRRSPVLEELQDALSRYAKGLYVEVGEVEDGTREIVITAAGERSLFPSAEALAAEAPSTTRWKVTPLKPARGFEFVLDTEGLHLDPDAMRFRALTNEADPGALGVRILVPFSRVDERLRGAVLTLLETGLGERATASLAHVEVAPLPKEPGDLLRLSELGDYIEWFREKALESRRDIH